MATLLTEHYGGDAARLWNDGAPAYIIHQRIEALPGFGRQKARKMPFVLHYLGYRDFSGTDGSR